jgi:hypothetical protein
MIEQTTAVALLSRLPRSMCGLIHRSTGALSLGRSFEPPIDRQRDPWAHGHDQNKHLVLGHSGSYQRRYNLS